VFGLRRGKRAVYRREHWQSSLQGLRNGDRKPISVEIAGFAGDIESAVAQPCAAIVRIIAGVCDQTIDDGLTRLPAIIWQAQMNPCEEIGTFAGSVQHVFVYGHKREAVKRDGKAVLVAQCLVLDAFKCKSRVLVRSLERKCKGPHGGVERRCAIQHIYNFSSCIAGRFTFGATPAHRFQGIPRGNDSYAPD
jgi:hypothetical protein